MGGGLILSSDALILKRATSSAIDAAGGQVKAAGQTVAGRSQLQRCASPNDADSITLRDALTIDAIGVQVQGHPFIARALAGLLGFGLYRLPAEDPRAADWLAQMGALSGEAGEIIAKMSVALADGRMCEHDVQSSGLEQDADQLLAIATSLHAAVHGVGGSA